MDTNGNSAVLAALLRKPVRTLSRVGKGGNSKVYRVVCDDGSRYAAKFYSQRTVDGLDRLEVEFSALRYLWEKGLRCVPQPLVANRGSQIAVYEYVDGAEIPAQSVTREDIDQVATFAGELKRLAMSDLDNSALPRAAEACFSLRGVHDTILMRIQRLESVELQSPSYRALEAFLSGSFTPALETVVAHAQAGMGEALWMSEIARGERTLSPSDFGFHNALRRPDGSIALLDFEYFGWDDPAKLICDFLLHPAMDLSESLKRRYVKRTLECLAADEALSRRLAFAYPLFGLKWCTILLNEFVPKFLERREFAVETSSDHEHVRMKQLQKSEHMLGRIMSDLGRFPVLELNKLEQAAINFRRPG